MKNLFKKIVVSILTFQAKILLGRHKPTIIAVTGSVGKTSMKDAIYSILKYHHSARKSEKSFNSDIGVPLTVLGLPNAWNNPFLWFKNLLDGFFIAFFSRQYPDYLILETGVDRPGDMSKLASWLSPSILVLTRFPDIPVHVEYFATPEAVIKEKMQLANALTENGVIVYNHDDDRIKAELVEVRQQAIGYGRYLPTQFKASTDEIIYNDDVPVGIGFTVDYVGETVPVRVNGAVGVPLVYTYTGAIAVAAQCGISLTDAATALASHQPPGGRMRIIKGLKGSILLDDTYNSSPIATEQALATLKEMKHAKRKVAVLGDMLELGRFSAGEHERIGSLVADVADALFTVGVRSRKTAEGALEFGLDEAMIFQYEEGTKAGKELQQFLQPGDVVLIKGSQGLRMEKVVEEVMAHPEEAGYTLVRQDTAWQHR
jgi:UDP-N-acetylmuramoyl-tripeptide--D-alanyl-D-alanine ligase